MATEDSPLIGALLRGSDITAHYSIRDFEYLIHHIEINRGQEQAHHCRLYDHIGNMFVQGHLVVKDGSVKLNGKKVSEGMFHILIGLEPTQEVSWSDQEAEESGINPKGMHDGMTLKEKAKVW